jgi:hypothetical protein
MLGAGSSSPVQPISDSSAVAMSALSSAPAPASGSAVPPPALLSPPSPLNRVNGVADTHPDPLLHTTSSSAPNANGMFVMTVQPNSAPNSGLNSASALRSRHINFEEPLPAPITTLAAPTPLPPTTPTPVSYTFFKNPKGTLPQIIAIGAAKSLLPWHHCFWLGVTAGAYIGLGGLLSIIVGGGLAANASQYLHLHLLLCNQLVAT